MDRNTHKLRSININNQIIMKKINYLTFLFLIILIFVDIKGIGQEKPRLCLQNTDSGKKDCYDIGSGIFFKSDSIFMNGIGKWYGKWNSEFGLIDILENPFRLVLSHRELVTIWIDGHYYDESQTRSYAGGELTTTTRRSVKGYYTTAFGGNLIIDTIEVALITSIGFYLHFDAKGYTTGTGGKKYKLGKNQIMTIEK